MKIMVLVMVLGLVAGMAPGNMLENSGFEAELGSDNWSTHWGTFSVESWNHPPEGQLAAFIKGKWGGGMDKGGCIQVVPVNSGTDHELKVRFYIDNGWTAANKALKLEFFDADGVLLRTYVDDLKTLREGQWIQVSLKGKSPEDAVRAQVVLEAEGIGEEGVLGADAFELREVSGRR